MSSHIKGVPLEPDPDQARNLLERELSKPEYDNGSNPLVDFLRWLGRLLSTPTGTGTGSPPLGFWVSLGIGVLALVAISAIVVIVMTRKGRLPVRSEQRRSGTLFGELDERSATEIRRAADEALRAGRFTAATIEGYRALARSLSERTIVEILPGTTALRCAADAGTAFPDFASDLSAAAREFDRVRYLGGDGSAVGAGMIRDLDARLQKARPASRQSPGHARLTSAEVSSSVRIGDR